MSRPSPNPVTPDTKTSGSASDAADVIDIVTSSRLPRARRKKTYWKNLLVLSISFFFVFTAFTSIQNLQSSLNTAKGIGVISLTIIYGSVVFSCLFIAPVAIRKLGTKWTITTSLVFYSIYTACNYYPSYATLIPSSVLIGLAAAPLWTAQGTYLTTSAISLADLTNEVPETLLNRFNGIFFFIFQSNQVVGNGISSLVLQQSNETGPSDNLNNCGRCSCGANTNQSEHTSAPSDSLVNILLTVYLVLGIIGLLLTLFFLETLPTFQSSQVDGRHFVKNLFDTIGMLTNPVMVLMVPLMVYSGVEQAFIASDFTKAYVTCALGIDWVGYVMMCYGVSDAVSSLLLGRLEKYVGRKVLFSVGGIVQMGLIVVMFFWHPNSDIWVFFVIAVGWGLGDAVWQTQLCSIIGILFPDRQAAAFANFRMWQSVGFSIAFAGSIPDVICVYHKLYAIGGWLILSMIGYYTLEVIVHQRETRYSPVSTIDK